MIDMGDYSPAARKFWWAILVLGGASLAWAVGELVEMQRAAQLQVLGLAVVAAVVGYFPVRMSRNRMSLAGGEIFVFLALLLHGPAAAILAGSVEGAVGAMRSSRRWTSRLGAPAMIALAMFACAMPFEGARTVLLASGYGTAALAAFGALYFAVNTALPATLLALKRREPVRLRTWWDDMVWIGLAYMASGLISGLLYASFERLGLPVLLVTAPMIVMFLHALHVQFEKREADERHMQELRASESRFHGAFTHAAIGMAIVSTEGRFLQANTAFCRMLGRPQHALPAFDLHVLVHPEDEPTLRGRLDDLLNGVSTNVHCEVRGSRADGGEVWMSLNVSLAREWNMDAENLIVQAQDVTARRRAEAELYHNAYHDSLTGLPNRKCLSEHLAHAIARWQRHPERHFALMYLDFDRFKMVNDSLGHRAGDELLVEMGRRLTAALRPADVVARLGGDEFVLLVEDLEHDRQALDLADRVQSQLSRPLKLSGIDLAVTASIGITFSSNVYTTAEQVVRDADIAMYQAKQRGRAQYALFDSSLHRLVAGQLKLESQLRQALAEGQLFLAYQPLQTVAEGHLVGFEALVRWRHPEHGILQPAAFIPAAEEAGLIVPLGQWVMAEACRQLKAWELAYGTRGLRVSVNVSSLELRHPRFVEHVRQCISQSGLAPSQLLLEVTETVMIDQVTNAVPTLRAVRQMGVAVGIDDFGTGYSSLNYLATLPIDVLKVDRCFIEPLGGDGDGVEIAKAIFRLGEALGKEVFAEGVETDRQLGTLREMGCPYAQGYLFSRPLDARQAEDFVRASVAAAKCGRRDWAPALAGAATIGDR